MKVLLFLLIANGLSSCISTNGYINQENQALKAKQPVWDFVEKHVGNCPKVIKIQYWNKKNSVFSAQDSSLTLGSSREKNEDHTIAHETSHLCLSSKTKQHSAMEQFRFIDEGLADIIKNRLKNNESKFRLMAGRMTKTYYERSPFKLKDVQKWSKFFGRFPNADFNVYSIGANFVYFIMDTYGEKTLQKFLVEIGNYNSVNEVIPLVLGESVKIVEEKWVSYFSVHEGYLIPQIIETFPKNGEGNVSRDIRTLVIKFNTPMIERSNTYTPPCELGVCPQNAKWQDAKTLNIFVSKKLRKNYKFKLIISPEKHPMHSMKRIPLDAYKFEFTTGDL